MRIAAEAVHLETIGQVEESSFKIKATGKAFRMLIDGLYSDKIGSIVREVASNAFDAHIVAGQTAPFFIHVPCMQRPEFFVRDYGCGMDHDTVMHLYSTLFESNKDESDELVGAFGLGSKSPFAYADQFSVSCYDGMIVRHYTAAIGNGGQPKIMLMGTEPCAEPQGVRVTLSVESKDYGAFEQAVRKIAMGFDPEFETTISLNQKRGTLAYQGEQGEWKCYTDSSLPATWNVRQGCVIYPLTNDGGLTLPQDHGRKWLIEAPIGTIAVTGSREAVQYKESVVAYLQQRINAVVADVEKRVWDKVKDITYVVEFFDTYQRLRPNFLTAAVTHPATGLANTTLRLANMASLYSAKWDDSRKRWGYSTEKSIDLRNRASLTCFNLRDVTPVLDPSREDAPTDDYSKSEGRRIARMLRAYCEEKDLTRGDFLMGVNFDADYIKAVLPKATITEVTFDELRMAAPRRVIPVDTTPAAPPIRGLALAIRAGDQSPVTEVSNEIADAAWIDSDTYRRRPEDIFKLANKFAISKLYIASPTAEKVVETAKVPKLVDAINSRMMTGVGVTLAEYQHMGQYLSTHDSLTTFARRLMEKDPEAFEKITRIKSPVATLFKERRPYFSETMPTLDDRDRQTIRQLFSPNNSYTAPARSARVKAFEDAHTLLRNANYHPTKEFLDGLGHAVSAEQVTACAEGIIAVLRILPLSMKFERN